MLPVQIIQIVEDEAIPMVETTAITDTCTPCGSSSNPWYNDLSHDITDSTIFRIILIIMVVDYVLKWLR